jgi:hypothetical protein
MGGTDEAGPIPGNAEVILDGVGILLVFGH